MKSPVNVRLLFFGAIAEIVGKRELNAIASTSSELLEDLLANCPQLARHKLYVSVNQEHVLHNASLVEGDEIAIFTAVSGG